MQNLKSIQLFGVKVTTDSKKNILKYIEESLENGGQTVKIYTPNPEIIMHARSHHEFMDTLNEANIALPDGIGIGIASFLCGKGNIPRISGTDFIFDLLNHLTGVKNSSVKISKNPYTLGFFGGKPGVAEKVADCLQKKYSGITISLATDHILEKDLKEKKIDILFVALGFPKQEEWISENLEKSSVKVAMGVGGAFDFIAGEVHRAPIFIRKVGLEWLFRLTVQPWRIKRQLALISFIGLTLKSIFSLRKRKSF